ncbi:M10 family metallopeptidase C-terminal domain-containing protein [Donghicola tyrosinivorans]|uniref:Ca2+-binding RTX toxin-like protein n=1 Tax=Donghicola tyrosinivorans TaxID=1652492 RepID=A0A2T0WS03_9RHOB|nr:M10 family metallopeptidase C-terminal domain-containing protein [Donghicola tyrosinivorans]PRY89470.1 Ca2+-binding RTX toxin-like protein [Donghicola tyrosinivorans]
MAEGTQTVLVFGATSGSGSDASEAAAQADFESQYDSLPDYSLAEVAADINTQIAWTIGEVSFAFPLTEAADYADTVRSGTLVPFTEAQIAAAREAMALIADVIDLDIVDAGKSVDADIRLYNSTLYGTTGSLPAGTGLNGDLWVYGFNELADPYDMSYGGYYFAALLRDLGRVFGLTETTSGTGGLTYEEIAGYIQDNQAYTIMSSNSAADAGLVWATEYPATPMVADILALQSLYGANMETRTGDTVYGFNANADRAVFDFDQLRAEGKAIAAVTIWDAGGIDTLDMSGFADDAAISLVDGKLSSVGGNNLNLGIAVGAVIENAIGGSGDDMISGNDANNVLIGGIGADFLEGGAGDDLLIGDFAEAAAATDYTHGIATMSRGSLVSYNIDASSATDLSVEMLVSFDEVSITQSLSGLPGGWSLSFSATDNGIWYSNGSAWFYQNTSSIKATDGDLHRLSVTLDSAASAVQVYIDGILCANFEGDVIPAAFTDREGVRFNHQGQLADVRFFNRVLTAKEIQENAFADIGPNAEGLISRLAVNAAGGVLKDTVSKDVANVSGDLTFETVALLTLDDTLKGGEGADTLMGGEGEDELYGNDGDDVLIGGAGADTLQGGYGDDMVDYRTSSEAVTINVEEGTGAGGDAEGDSLFSIEVVLGSGYDDLLIGSASDDVLRGANGNDTVRGGAGSDVLRGGNGDDVLRANLDDDRLVGGAGADILDGGQGSDTVLYNNSDEAVIIDLGAGTGQGGQAEGDRLINIERVLGSEGNDILIGDDADNVLAGNVGRDTVMGAGGNDTLFGGAGADTFVFQADGSTDTVQDFGRGEDVLDLSATDAGFTLLTFTTIEEGTLVSYDGLEIILRGVAVEELDAQSFIFAEVDGLL